MATTTVYFATNRVLNGPAEDGKSYGTNIVSSSDPTAITYAVAFVDSTELTADKTGFITDIRDVKQGHFSENVISDLQERDEICWFSSMALTTTLRPRSPAPRSIANGLRNQQGRQRARVGRGDQSWSETPRSGRTT
jgi:hypothetical protein